MAFLLFKQARACLFPLLLLTAAAASAPRAAFGAAITFEIVGKPTLTFTHTGTQQTGSFEVDIVSTLGTQPQIGDFTAQIEKTDPNSYVTFESIIAPSATYILSPQTPGFLGTDGSDPNSAVASDGFTGSAGANPTLGALSGLMTVDFTLNANAPAGATIPLNFVTNPDADFPLALDDQNGSPIAFGFTNSAIVVTAVSAPEPSSLFLAVLAGVALLGYLRRRRQAA